MRKKMPKLVVELDPKYKNFLKRFCKDRDITQKQLVMRMIKNLMGNI